MHAITRGKGKIRGNHFEFNAAGQNRIEISLNDVKTNPGERGNAGFHSNRQQFIFLLIKRCKQ